MPSQPLAAAVSRWMLLALCLLALLALALRTAGLAATGVGGNDTILYYTLAEYWLDGKPVFRIGSSAEVFRPVLLAYNALALQVFGHTDYAIKLANTVIDSLNVLMVAALAWGMSRRWSVALASALAYALLPLAVWASRHELPHTLSTFFVLSAMLSAWLAVDGGARPRLLSGAAGLMLASATLTHEELVFMALPVGLVLLLLPRLAGREDSLRDAAWRLGVFALPPGIAALVLLWHGSAAAEVLTAPAALAGAGRFYPEVLARFFWNGLSGAGSTVFLGLVALGLLVFGWKVLADRGKRARRYCLVYLCCTGSFLLFLALYALFFNTLFVRGLLPLVPLLLIAIFYSVVLLCERLGRAASSLVVLALAVCLGIGNLGAYSAFKVGNRDYSSQWDVPAVPDRQSWMKGYRGFRYDAAYDPSYYTHWANVHNALEGRVNEHNRLLLLPSTVIHSPGRRPLQTRVYFGDNVIYRLDHSGQPLAQLIRQKRVRYVLFTLGQRRRLPANHSRYLYDGRWAAPAPLDLARDYGMDSYSADAELRQLMEVLNALGARPLALFQPGTYEAQRARAWVLP